VGLERGPLSLARITEELLERKVAAPVEKSEINLVRTRCADHTSPTSPQKLALTSPTSGGRSVGMVRLRTKSHAFNI
jgi:hypothetical protein